MTQQPEINDTDVIYTKQQLFSLEEGRIPKHVAIIMDGNRRWAGQRSLPGLAGHWAGAQTLTHIVKAASELGIKTLTVYSFSTENWFRPQEEIQGLFDLFEIYLREQRTSMVKEGVRLDTIGDLSPFPISLINTIRESKEATSRGEKIDLVLALNYGGRDDIRRALKMIAQDYSNKTIEEKDLTEQTITKYLDTAKWRDPDLLIRTSREMRLSNFLLWQVSYSEIHVSSELWPDFTSQHLYEAVVEYQNRKRRFGT